jgi:type IX secretion system PorP/SprF family membrane protein
MKIRLIAVVIIITLHIVNCFGQSGEVSNYYLLDKYVINPAEAGIDKYQPVIFSYKQKWLGVKDAPNSQTLISHRKLTKKIGVGIKVFNESYGVLRKTGGEITYGYSLPIFKRKGVLKFGLSGIFYQKGLNYSKLELQNNIDDKLYLNGYKAKFVPDIALGISAYMHGINVGVAVPRVIQLKTDLTNEDIMEFRENREYIIYGSYGFKTDLRTYFEPGVLARVQENGDVQVDINMRLKWKKKLNLGVSYRSADAFVLFTGVDFSKISVFYSYEMGVSNIVRYSTGSHELMITYRFYKDRGLRKKKSLF